MKTNLQYRFLNFGSKAPQTLNEATRSVIAIVATSTPCLMPDEVHGMVSEILEMKGCVLPASGQIPLLDSHNRDAIRSISGHCKEFRTGMDEISATLYLGGDPLGLDAFQKIKDGSLTDVSIGYRNLDSEIIPGADVPTRLVRRWSLHEVSLTAFGADPNAKIRNDNFLKGIKNMETDIVTKTPEEILAEERARVSEISAMGARLECRTLADDLITRGATLETAKAQFLKIIESRYVDPPPQRPPRMMEDETDKKRDAMIDGLIMRSGVPLQKPARGAEDFRGCSVADIARASIGEKARHYNPDRAIREALSTRSHTTSDFPYILANVAGKVLRETYAMTPSTFEKWTSKSDARDFKEMSRTALSEADSLDEIAEGEEYKFGTFGESCEVYRIVTFGKKFKISRQALVNDDLSAFTRTPLSFSRRAKMQLNQAVYSVLTANSNMSDGVPLFHATHSNFVGSGSGGSPSIVTLSDARLAMRRQTGLNSELIGVQPRFLIVPASLETSSDQILNTNFGYESSSGLGIVNPFYRKLELIVEPYLDDVSADGWYLSADRNSIDTIEIAYLNGIETPFLSVQDDWNTDGVEYKIRFDYGIKALDWRGLYFNYGA